MEILKFALGIRFDTLKDQVSEEDIRLFLSEVSHAVDPDLLEEAELYGGVCPIDKRDSRGIYTLVFMNGGIRTMRRLYAELDSDARIAALLDSRCPYTQNNVIRNYEGMEFIGRIVKGGALTGGSGRLERIAGRDKDRPLHSEACRIVLAPNAFKGTFTAGEAVRRLQIAVRDRLPEVITVPVPTADGGDGTLDAIECACSCMRRSVKVTDPVGKPVQADYLVIDGTKAVIESALASGIALIGNEERDPLRTTSFGTGELMLRAAKEGVKEIVVCLGGSATNDCGIGLARALGCRFLSEDGSEIESAADMELIRSIDVSNISKLVKDAAVTVVCDVDAPLTGEHGATYTFGPQKGADDEALEKLEKGMKNMEKLLNAHAGAEVCSNPGAGAAGGMGAMLMAVFGARFGFGAEAVLSAAEMDRKLKGASLVITGEGAIDATSLRGKAVGAVIEHARRAQVPYAVIAGKAGEGAQEIIDGAAAVSFTGSEIEPEKHFDEAARRLMDSVEDLIRPGRP